MPSKDYRIALLQRDIADWEKNLAYFKEHPDRAGHGEVVANLDALEGAIKRLDNLLKED